MASQDNASGLVLPFYEPLQLLQTKPFDYSLISKQGGGGGGGSAVIANTVRSEFLAELAYHRNAVSAWLSYAATGFGASGARAQLPDAVLQDLTSLAARLHGLAVALTAEPAAAGSTTSGSVGGTMAAVSLVRAAVLTSGLIRTEWTSALSNKPQRMLRLDSLPQELAMVYTATAAALRQSALQRVHEYLAPAGPGTEQRNEGSGGGGNGGGGSIGGSEDAGGTASGSMSGGGSSLSAVRDVGGALTAAVGVLRKAAGLYGYLADVLLPDVVGAGASNGGDRPLELLPAAARLMRSLCLGEAQALVAAAAVGKGLSYGTQRALHAGCVALFQQAEGALRDLKAAAPPGLPPSDRMSRLVALYVSLHAALSYRAVAAERQKALELGEAEAACEECGRLLSTALRRFDRSDPPFWSTVFNTHQTALAPLQSEVNKDRLSVTYQPLPQQPQDATANPATRVTEDSFAPSPVMPQAPPVEEAGKGGCCIM